MFMFLLSGVMTCAMIVLFIMTLIDFAVDDDRNFIKTTIFATFVLIVGVLNALSVVINMVPVS